MDSRDAITWISVELSPLGEQKVLEGTLEQTLRNDLGVDDSFPIFIPARTFYRKTRARAVTIVLMEGYCFIGSGLPDVKYFALEKRAYVTQVLSRNTGQHKVRTLVTMPDVGVLELRNKLTSLLASEVEVGSQVNITGGKYKRLSGPVIGFDDNGHAIVTIALRSWVRNAHIPQALLEPVASE